MSQRGDSAGAPRGAGHPEAAWGRGVAQPSLTHAALGLAGRSVVGRDGADAGERVWSGGWLWHQCPPAGDRVTAPRVIGAATKSGHVAKSGPQGGREGLSRHVSRRAGRPSDPQSTSQPPS